MDHYRVRNSGFRSCNNSKKKKTWGGDIRRRKDITVLRVGVGERLGVGLGIYIYICTLCNNSRKIISLILKLKMILWHP